MTFFRFKLGAIILHSPLNSVILDDPSNLSASIGGSVSVEAPNQSKSKTIMISQQIVSEMLFGISSMSKVDLSYGICQSILLIQREDYLT
jgi:hypothetical protein